MRAGHLTGLVVLATALGAITASAVGGQPPKTTQIISSTHWRHMLQQHPGTPTGIMLDGHEYLGPVVGEVNADGTPVSEKEQQTGMMQHSEVFGRLPPEDAPLALPFDANGHMLDPVYRNPCVPKDVAARQHVGVPLWCPEAPAGSSSRHRLVQQPSGGAVPPQNAVVDMTHSALEAAMMAPPSSSGQAHIEGGDGTVATYVPDTVACRAYRAQQQHYRTHPPRGAMDRPTRERRATMMDAPPSAAAVAGFATVEQGQGTTVAECPQQSFA